MTSTAHEAPSLTHQRVGTRISQIFEVEERKALFVAALVRFAVLGALALIMIDYSDPREELLYDLGQIALFVPVGIVQLLLGWGKITRVWPLYLLVLVDAAMLAVISTAPYPFDNPGGPVAIESRQVMIPYSMLFFVFAALSYSPWLMAWAGACATVVWSFALLWFLDQPGAFMADDLLEAQGFEDESTIFLDPNFVNVSAWAEQIIICLLMAGGLAVVVQRARLLAQRSASAERQRANLARYFSPNVVDEVATRDEPLSAGTRREVAVMFCDIVGFTAMTERMAPEAVLDLLRGFHGRMEAVIFAHGGTLLKYIGDEVMAVFGAPASSGRDAADALACARAMIETLETWNRERVAAGDAPLQVGIGLHYGPAVVGDIGSERSMAFDVLGATVNLASRIEGLTRSLEADVVISAALAEAARQDSSETGHSDPTTGFANAGTANVKGFDQPVAVLTWTKGITHVETDL